ncbi:MAG TPA: ATP phosphoribosyltransferase regulatory subunit, partial [Bdellovibrionota bacterium]|nr:ATP phosphoribosyltransferase regulatory subunit [Bdellovibrionota bacterium]
MREDFLQRSPGTADFLPKEALQVESAIRKLESLFKDNHYQPVITPLFERVANIEAGVNASTFADTFRMVDPLTGEMVALRPDMTPQVARLVATQFHHIDPPYRLYYTGRVVRFGSRDQGIQRELFQAGVELMGDGSPEADAEVMLLAIRGLQTLGVKDLKLEIGNVGYVHSLLDGAKFNEQDRLRYLNLLHRKERSAIQELLSELSVEENYRRPLVQLPDLFGNPEILETAAELLTPLSTADAISAVESVRTIVSQLQEAGEGGRLLIDFGEV